MPKISIQFKILIWLLLAWYLFFYTIPYLSFIGNPELNENRIYAQFPEKPKTFVELKKYPSSLSAYIADNFGARSFFISWVNYLRYKLGYSALSKVYVGDNGWLFYDNGTHFSQLRQNHRSLDAFKGPAQSIFNQSQGYKNRGIEFLLITPPNKEIVYPELLPQWLRVGGYLANSVMLRKSIDRLGADSFYLDLLTPLSFHAHSSNPTLVYSPFDTHWTDIGALLSSRLILEAWFGKINLSPRSSIQYEYVKFVDNKLSLPQDLAYMLGIARFVDQQFPRLIMVKDFQPKKVEFLTDKKDWTADRIIFTESVGPTLLLVGDSFSTSLIPLFAPYFSRIVFSHYQSGFFRDDLVDKYHPKYILLEVQEGGIPFIR